MPKAIQLGKFGDPQLIKQIYIICNFFCDIFQVKLKSNMLLFFIYYLYIYVVIDTDQGEINVNNSILCFPRHATKKI